MISWLWLIPVAVVCFVAGFVGGGIMVLRAVRRKGIEIMINEHHSAN